jgi:hypothetical protein
LKLNHCFFWILFTESFMTLFIVFMEIKSLVVIQNTNRFWLVFAKTLIQSSQTKTNYVFFLPFWVILKFWLHSITEYPEVRKLWSLFEQLCELQHNSRTL